MTTRTLPKPEEKQPSRWRLRKTGHTRAGHAIIARGEPLVWLTGGALALALTMVLGLLALVVWQGLGTFWPQPLTQVTTAEGKVYLGEITRDEHYEVNLIGTESWEQIQAETESQPWFSQAESVVYSPLPAADDSAGDAEKILMTARLRRQLFRTGNFDLTQTHFHWINDYEIQEESHPEWALIIERIEWGRFYGTPKQFVIRHLREIHPLETSLAAVLKLYDEHWDQVPADQQAAADEALKQLETDLQALRRTQIDRFLEPFRDSAIPLEVVLDDQTTVTLAELQPEQRPVEVRELFAGPEAAWEQYLRHHEAARQRYEMQRELETEELGEISRRLEAARLNVRQAELDDQVQVLPLVQQMQNIDTELEGVHAQTQDFENLALSLERYPQAGEPLARLTRQLTTQLVQPELEKLNALQARRDDLQQQISELPAGARQAVEAYFTELQGNSRAEMETTLEEIRQLKQENSRYELQLTTAQQESKTLQLSEIVRAYPANQLDFGGKLDIYFSRWGEFFMADPREANSEGGVFPAIVGTVVMTVLMSLAVVPFGVLAALFLREYAKAGPLVSSVRIAINNLAGVPSIVFGVFGLGFFCYGVGGSIDQMFFEAHAPNPVYGKSGLIWASFTLALLTLPVVIVATEEALAAVPNSMREGSYACGASKWQTIWRIVLPRAMPGIMTGMILAMARGAGEVAPLMLVGAVKLAPELPLDGTFPFIHPDRSFMHLGFHIFDLGFQSQNSEAAKPMLFTTTLLLIGLIFLMNIFAIWLRSRLRKKFAGSQF